MMTCKRSLLRACSVATFCLLAAIAARAQTFSVFYEFPSPGTEGIQPSMTMIQGTDGNFYGTTPSGGGGELTHCVNNVGCGGTIFKITPSGVFTLLYTFCSAAGCPDGESPYAGLVQASDGNFYGTTYSGGTYGFGTIYRITPLGVLTSLHSFCSANCSANDGYGPKAGLVQASNGALYGATTGNSIFKITTGGQFTLVYTFPCCAGGQNPGPDNALIQASNGLLYGTTQYDGTNGKGTVFSMTLAGAVTTLYNFCSQSNCADGSLPVGGLVRGNDGNFYGTTSSGGTGGGGGFGTIFKITPAGSFTSLYSFTATGLDGANPVATMTLATDGSLYGTTEYGGGNTGGVVFQVVNGVLANEYPVGTGCIGGHPVAGLLQSTDGNFYGTDLGGCADYGTIFEFTTGLGAFVTTTPAFGKVGTRVVIEGTDLTGSTSVTFNGTRARFTVVSPTQIVTQVPTGATSGRVRVLTPGGTLASNISFVVK